MDSKKRFSIEIGNELYEFLKIKADEEKRPFKLFIEHIIEKSTEGAFLEWQKEESLKS